MLDSEAEVLDPRLRQLDQRDAKRLRSGGWPSHGDSGIDFRSGQPLSGCASAAGHWPADTSVVATAPAPVQNLLQDWSRSGVAPSAAPAGISEDSLSAHIVDTLQRLLPSGQDLAPASLPRPVPAEPELGSLLLDSLRTLLPTSGACQSSEGQQLMRVVQQSMPAPAPQATARDPRLGPELRSASLSALDLEKFVGNDGAPIRLPPANVASAAQVLEDELRSGDGVPHRLPPGFGAIPEDLIAERARQREEERIRRIKGTQPCRFGRVCKRRDCMNAHPEGREIDHQLNACAFGRRCKRKTCFYDHPEGREIDDDPSKGVCKFGKKCRNPECLYDHPEGRDPVSGADLRVCYFCHDAGHIATDCPQNPESWAYNLGRERERRLANSDTPALTDGAVTAPAPSPGAAPVTQFGNVAERAT